MALIASWPSPLHEGLGKASYYIDNRVDEKQCEALSNIIVGRAVPILIFLLWLGIGIGQWFVLSKWTKKYERHKELQK
jgi:hypothetical protein